MQMAFEQKGLWDICSRRVCLILTTNSCKPSEILRNAYQHPCSALSCTIHELLWENLKRLNDHRVDWQRSATLWYHEFNLLIGIQTGWHSTFWVIRKIEHLNPNCLSTEVMASFVAYTTTSQDKIDFNRTQGRPNRTLHFGHFLHATPNKLYKR